MSKLNKNKKWSKSEEEDLLDSYINEELDLPLIADIHERSLLGIASRLVKLNAAEDIASVKGYTGSIPMRLRSLRATGPIITKQDLLCNPSNDNSNDLLALVPFESEGKTSEEKDLIPTCTQSEYEEMKKEIEYLKLQLFEAMDTIKVLTDLL